MWISFLSKMSMKKGRPPIKVKRPRQPAVRHKAGPLALLNFVVNKTASFFLYSFRQFSTWKRNWIKDDKRSNPLKIKAFSVCRYYTVTAYPRQFADWHGLYTASGSRTLGSRKGANHHGDIQPSVPEQADRSSRSAWCHSDKRWWLQKTRLM